MTFTYPRTVRFQETDGAGVVYFANVLVLCHEAYEASLVDAGIAIKEFFSPTGVVVPVVHAAIDFFRPFYCGDRLLIRLTPTRLSESEFEIAYQLSLESAPKASARALTRHVCIEATSRQRTAMTQELEFWLGSYSSDSPPSPDISS